MKKLVLAAAILALPATGFAKNTGWIDGKKLWSMTPKISAESLPTKIACKDSGRGGLSLHSAMVKFDVVPANGKRFYWWVVWDKHDIKGMNKRMKETGFRLVSKDSFRRKTGITIRCFLFHK